MRSWQTPPGAIKLMNTQELQKSSKENRYRSMGISFGNPVFVKEFRALLRQQRSRAVITFFLISLAVIAFILYGTIISTNTISPDPDIRRTLGKIIFHAIVFLQLVAIVLFTPLFSSDSITSEKENKAIDLLRITLQSPASIITGKLFSGFIFILLLLFVSLPLKSGAYLLGGITISEYIISTVLLITTTLFLCSLSIWASSLSTRTSSAMGMTYIIAGIILLGFPALGYVIIKLAPIPDDQDLFMALQLILKGLDANPKILFSILVWIFIASNPITTAIVSYNLFQIEGLRILYSPSLFTINFPLLAPWVTFILLYLITIWFLYRSAIKQIAKRDKL